METRTRRKGGRTTGPATFAPSITSFGTTSVRHVETQGWVYACPICHAWKEW
jgi:hypothetical protein